MKVGDVDCRGGKSLPGNRLAGTFEYVCQVAPGDAKGSRAAPRKTPLISISSFDWNSLCETLSVCLRSWVQGGPRGRQFFFPGHAYEDDNK